MHTPEGQARQKKQEQRIVRALERAGFHFKREHQITFDCLENSNKYARIDFVLVEHERIVFLEVDEDQHMFGADGGTIRCDMKRMGNVIEALTLGGNTLPICFVRYNPNAFRVNGELQRINKTHREKFLVEFLNDPNNFPDMPLSIRYLFYDTQDGEIPEVCLDADYNEQMRECCLPLVVCV
eukprot:jgi/Botrbrau1/12708/Bobra.67_1s0071.1